MSIPEHDLPQLGDEIFLTDAGLETDLIFNDGHELPEFAAITLLSSDAGRQALADYFWRHVSIARRHGTGFIFESPTWRASADWAEPLGYTIDELRDANREAIALMTELRDEAAVDEMGPTVISGCIGPRGDGYDVSEQQPVRVARSYHAFQAETFAESGADMVTAITMNHLGEAAGVALAAADAGLPSAISFTVETDGLLPDGSTLREAIEFVDDETGGGPAYFMINCAHPDHFAGVLESDAAWTQRVRGLRANASRKSHAELDDSETLDAGDPRELAELYARLRLDFPQVTVLGGCCGTDARHIEQIAEACVSR